MPTKQKAPYSEYRNLGFRADRLEDDGNSLEQSFALRWERLNVPQDEQNEQDDSFLSEVLTKQNPWGLTEDDRMVAATLIQWLGTAIGQDFLSRVSREHGLNPRANLGGLFREKWRLLNIAGGNHKQHRFFQNMFLIRAFDGAVLSTRIKVAPRGVMLAERLFYWLGSESGQEFLASTEIVRLTDEE